MKSGTEIGFCPLCRHVLWLTEPMTFRKGDGVIIATVDPSQHFEHREQQVRSHYESRHRFRWWLAQRWPRVLKWVLTVRVRPSW